MSFSSGTARYDRWSGLAVGGHPLSDPSSVLGPWRASRRSTTAARTLRSATSRLGTQPTDPNLLYEKERAVMDYQLLVASEMESFIRVLGTAGPGRMPEAAERALHAQLHQYLQPALDRFNHLDSDHEREGFRQALQDFVHLYSLIAQIVAWGDRDLERLFQYGRLLIRLPGRPQVSVDVGDADLSH